jgi:hypothetical protein
MDPLHLYVVCIVCGGRESHRGVFLKRALGPPILRKYAYRSRFRFRKCASSSPWRGGGMSLSSEIVRCDLHRYTKKRASVSAVAHDAGRKLQKMRVVSVRSGSDSAFLCESGSVSGVRNAYFRKCGHRRRSVARSFGSPIEISREWEGHHGSSITRIFGRTATRIFGSGSCRRGTQLVWAGSWRLPDAPTTSGSSRSRRRRASKGRLNSRWSLRAASAACSRRMPPCPPLAAARLIARSWQHR